jgi:hypothetical protein
MTSRPLTVGELIARLQTLDPELPVLVHLAGDYVEPALGVRHAKVSRGGHPSRPSVVVTAVPKPNPEHCDA